MERERQILWVLSGCVLIFTFLWLGNAAIAFAQPAYDLFQDDFEVPGDFTTTWSVLDGAYAVENGGFGGGTYWAHGTSSGENDPAMALNGSQGLSWGDYTFEYDVEFSSNDPWVYSFGYARLQSDTAWTVPGGPPNGYRIALKAHQNAVSLDRIVGGVITELANTFWTIDQNTAYHVAITLYGSTISVYVAGTLALSVTDDTYGTGTIALSGSTGGGSTTHIDIYYDNVKVSVSRGCEEGSYASVAEDFEGLDPLGYYWSIPDGNVLVEAGDFGFGTLLAHGSATGENDPAILYQDPDALNWGRISFQTDMRFSSNDPWSYAMFFFALPSVTDWNVPSGPPNGYRAIMKNNQDEVELAKIVDGVVTVLAVSSYAVSQNTDYLVRIDFESPQIIMYVNGEMVLQTTDTTYDRGTVALAAGTGGGSSSNVDIYWDNIAVCVGDGVPTYDACTFTDDCELPGNIAHHWSVVDGTATQESEGVLNSTTYIHTYAEGEYDGAILCKWPGALDWCGYQLTLDLMFASNDAWSYGNVYFCLQDTTGWVAPGRAPDGYRLTLKNQQNEIELSKREAGIVSVLTAVSYPVERNTEYRICVERYPDGLIQVFVDGSEVLSLVDSTFTCGSIALSGGTGGGASTHVDAYFDNIAVCTGDLITLGVPLDEPLVDKPVLPRPLLSIAPNPAPGKSMISFALSRPGEVQLKVYDVKGRLVASLPPEHLAAGNHDMPLDLRAQVQRTVETGTYLLRLTTPDGVKTGKMVFLK